MSTVITKSDGSSFDLLLPTSLDRLKCPQLCPRLLLPPATALVADSRQKQRMKIQNVTLLTNQQQGNFLSALVTDILFLHTYSVVDDSLKNEHVLKMV
jgi:hypothetical protein